MFVLVMFVFVFVGKGTQSGSRNWIVSGTGCQGLFLNLCLFFLEWEGFDEVFGATLEVGVLCGAVRGRVGDRGGRG